MAIFNSASYAAEKVFKVGIVPQYEQRQLFRNWKPLLHELEKNTGLKFELTVSQKIPAFEKHFLSGLYDIAYVNPYHVLKANAAQGYIPVVRDSRNLKGVLVVNNNSPVNDINSLQNSKIAFPSPNSLGASLLMRSILDKQFNLRFQSKYVNTHGSVYLHVAKNLVDAGGGVNISFNRQKKIIQEKLKIIYQTPEIVSHPIVFHPRVSEKNQKIIYEGLFKVIKTKRGKQLFSKVPINNLVATKIEDYRLLEMYQLENYLEK